MLQGDDKRAKKLLFEKLLLNSSKLFVDMRIFDKAELERLVSEYEVPIFNHDYIAKRKNMIEVFFFDKPLTINELKWIV